MANETVDISFRANIKDLRTELGKIHGISEGEAKRMVIGLERQMKKAEAAAKKAAKGTENAWSKGLGSLAKSGGFGALTEKLTNLGASVSVLGPEAVIAAVVAAAAFGVFAAAAYAAEEAVSYIWDHGMKESKVAQENMKGFSKTWDELGKAVGTQYADAVAEWTLLIEAGALAVKDVGIQVLKWAAALDAMGPSFRQTIDGLAESIPLLDDYLDRATMVTDQMREDAKVAKAMGSFRKGVIDGLAYAEKDLTKKVGAELDKRKKDAEKAAQDAKDLAFDLSEAKAQLWLDEKSDLEDAEAIADQMMADGFKAHEEFVAAQATIDKQAAAERMALIQEEMQSQIDAYDAAAAARKDASAQIVASSMDAASQMIGAIQSVLDFEAQAHQDSLAQIRAKRTAIIEAAKSEGGTALRTAQTAIDIQNDRAKHEKKILLRMFRAKQAADVAAIAMSTASAMIGALGPPPMGLGPIAGAIAAGGIAAAGAVQAGVALAQKPPTFHVGTSSVGGAEVAATLARGEGVVTASGMAKPGAKDAVEALNSGTSGGSQRAGLYINGRAAAEIVIAGIQGSRDLQMMIGRLARTGAV